MRTQSRICRPQPLAANFGTFFSRCATLEGKFRRHPLPVNTGNSYIIRDGFEGSPLSGVYQFIEFGCSSPPILQGCSANVFEADQ